MAKITTGIVRCNDCYNFTTYQRQFDITTIDANISPRKVQLERLDSGKKSLTLEWPDGHISNYSIDWLVNSYDSGASQSEWNKQLLLWDAKTIEGNMPVNYKRFLQDEDGLKVGLRNLAKYGFLLVEGTPATFEDTQKVAERVSFIRETIYGKMWGVTDDMEFADVAYSDVHLRGHTDTTYFNEPSGVQIFHCLRHDGEGGKTLLVDGFHAAMKLKDKHPKYYKTLSQVPLCHHYLDTKRKLHIRGIGPVLQHDPINGDLMHIRFNTFDRHTISHLGNSELMTFYEAYLSFGKELNSPDNELQIKLWPGTVLLVDNWRVLHGRTSFTGQRQICGCFMPRDDLNSRYRTLLNMSV
ncbi:trimethyllysine dioxygenase, mitochondrial-like [Glandiceps talaboti]